LIEALGRKAPTTTTDLTATDCEHETHFQSQMLTHFRERVLHRFDLGLVRLRLSRIRLTIFDLRPLVVLTANRLVPIRFRRSHPWTNRAEICRQLTPQLTQRLRTVAPQTL
jgi:hypothetical protein